MTDARLAFEREIKQEVERQVEKTITDLKHSIVGAVMGKFYAALQDSPLTKRHFRKNGYQCDPILRGVPGRWKTLCDHPEKNNSGDDFSETSLDQTDSSDDSHPSVEMAD